MESQGEFVVTRGHSKGHRPDLKQIKLGLGVQQNGQIVMGQMLAGNKSDKTWNPQAAVEMKEFFTKKGYKNIVFVSDSATISLDALETFSLANQLKEEAWQADQWQDVGKLSEKGSCYKVWYDERELEGKNYSFVVVHSSALQQQKGQTLKKRFSKQKESLEKKYKNIANQSFACIPDAQKALDKLIKEVEGKGFEISTEIWSK